MIITEEEKVLTTTAETTDIRNIAVTMGNTIEIIEKYDGLDFVTVKGVGHMAPQWARQPMQDMITSWIHDEPF